MNTVLGKPEILRRSRTETIRPPRSDQTSSRKNKRTTTPATRPAGGMVMPGDADERSIRSKLGSSGVGQECLRWPTTAISTSVGNEHPCRIVWNPVSFRRSDRSAGMGPSGAGRSTSAIHRARCSVRRRVCRQPLGQVRKCSGRPTCPGSGAQTRPGTVRLRPCLPASSRASQGTWPGST